MKTDIVLSIIAFFLWQGINAQQDTTKTDVHSGIIHEDPSQVLTRFELFNELQHLQNGEDRNVTTFRGVVGFGKRFTTRLDIPLVYYSGEVADYDQYGLGDISIRLLGYKLIDRKTSALLASVEFSFNSAQSPLLGTGKNIIIPVITYSKLFMKQQTVLALSLQEYYSLGGDETRPDIRFTKMQVYYLKGWTKNVWTLLLPEIYLDNRSNEFSMDVELSIYYRLTSNLAIWGKGGVGLFGNLPARYDYTSEIGLRYLLKFGKDK